VEFSSSGLQEVQVFRPKPVQGSWSGEIPSNRSVYGRVDAVGLHLTWKAPPEPGVTGYHLYRRKPVAGLVRVNRHPIPTRDVWVVEVFGNQNIEWVVTAITGKSREVPVGSWTWVPTPMDLDLLDKEPLSRLISSPQPERKLFLDWSRLPESQRYSLFYAEKDETVFYYFGDLKGRHPCAYIQIMSRSSGYQFLVAPKGWDGRWLSRTTVTALNELPK
jgi:hypothetical protein